MRNIVPLKLNKPLVWSLRLYSILKRSTSGAGATGLLLHRCCCRAAGLGQRQGRDEKEGNAVFCAQGRDGDAGQRKNGTAEWDVDLGPGSADALALGRPGGERRNRQGQGRVRGRVSCEGKKARGRRRLRRYLYYTAGDSWIPRGIRAKVHAYSPRMRGKTFVPRKIGAIHRHMTRWKQLC